MRRLKGVSKGVQIKQQKNLPPHPHSFWKYCYPCEIFSLPLYSLESFNDINNRVLKILKTNAMTFFKLTYQKRLMSSLPPGQQLRPSFGRPPNTSRQLHSTSRPCRPLRNRSDLETGGQGAMPPPPNLKSGTTIFQSRVVLYNLSSVQ